MNTEINLVAQRFADRQINILMHAAIKLHAWALQYGDEDQLKIAEQMLAAIRHVEPKFTYNAPMPETRTPKVRLYPREK